MKRFTRIAGLGLSIATLLAIPGSLRAQAPVPVAERIVVNREVATRVTLFSNRAVIVTIRQGDEQTFFRRITLEPEDYLVYLETLNTEAGKISDDPTSSDVQAEASTVMLTLHVGPDAPRLFRFSPLAISSLPLSRVMGALDDLEATVVAASPSAQELTGWEPREGDRVQLFNNRFAEVVEILDDGLIVLEHEDTGIREYVPESARTEVILHLVEREP